MKTSSPNKSPAEQLANDQRIFKFQEVNHEDGTPGREIAFSEFAFIPLGYAELQSAVLHRPTRIPLVGHGTVVSSSIENLTTGQSSYFRATLESQFTSKSIGLVRGDGYLQRSRCKTIRWCFRIDAWWLSSTHGLRMDSRKLKQRKTSLISSLTVRFASIRCSSFWKEMVNKFRGLRRCNGISMRLFPSSNQLYRQRSWLRQMLKACGVFWGLSTTRKPAWRAKKTSLFASIRGSNPRSVVKTCRFVGTRFSR